jgi:SAM-dependent methyltransferase
MTFNVAATAYDRFMGVYATPLAREFATLLGVDPGQRVLDVGCGPGALTTEVLRRGAAVSAVDPTEQFVAAVRERCPGVDARVAGAEALPFPDGGFDVVAAQLVVQFMADPVAGVAEMVRVTRPGGVVGSCIWDHATGRGPVSVFWEGLRQLGDEHDESGLPGVAEGDLVRRLTAAGLADVQGSVLTVAVDYPTFDAWWEPYALGVGPAGAHLARLAPDRQAALRDRCASLLPDGPFTVTACAWAATGRVPG